MLDSLVSGKFVNAVTWRNRSADALSAFSLNTTLIMEALCFTCPSTLTVVLNVIFAISSISCSISREI